MSDELRSIKKASFARRIIAFIMDGAVALFVFFAFFLFVFSPIANNALGMKKAVADGSTMQVESGLYVKVEQNKVENYLPLNKCGFESKDEYFIHLKDYYCTFKTEKAPDYNVAINNENWEEVLPKDYYTEDWFNAKFASVTDVSGAKQASVEALNDFSKYLYPYERTVNLCKLFIAGCSFTVSFSIFFILVPLLFKNGETFGKKTMGLGFVTKDCFSVKKRQIVLRQLFLFVVTLLFSFYLGVGYTSFATLGLGILIYYVATIISKTNRSVADYLSYTYLIDAKNSVWFKDQNEEEKKQKIVEENLSKYNKNDELDKHVIQVGSEIVNEEIKKEIDDLKKQNKGE